MTDVRCYLLSQALDKLQMTRATFFALKRAGTLTCVEEIKPRLGRRARYRADMIDRYVSGQWNQPRSFASHRKLA